MFQQAGSIRSLMKGNILVLTVSRVIWSMSNSIVYPLPLSTSSSSGGASRFGLVNDLGGLGGLFLYPVGGYVADKSGRAKLVGLATFLYSSSFLLFIPATGGPSPEVTSTSPTLPSPGSCRPRSWPGAWPSSSPS